MNENPTMRHEITGGHLEARGRTLKVEPLVLRRAPRRAKEPPAPDPGTSARTMPRAGAALAALAVLAAAHVSAAARVEVRAAPRKGKGEKCTPRQVRAPPAQPAWP